MIKLDCTSDCSFVVTHQWFHFVESLAYVCILQGGKKTVK